MEYIGAVIIVATLLTLLYISIKQSRRAGEAEEKAKTATAIVEHHRGLSKIALEKLDRLHKRKGKLSYDAQKATDKARQTGDLDDLADLTNRVLSVKTDDLDPSN